MKPEQCAYWLQGFFELSNATQLNEQETMIIKDHLKLVFDKQTPSYDKLQPVEVPTWKGPYVPPVFSPRWDVIQPTVC